MRLSTLLASALLAAASPALATPAEDFARLLDEHYAWLLRESPTYATALGVRDHDMRIQDNSPAAREGRIAQARAFLARLERIPADQLSPADRVTYGILRRDLAEGIEAWGFGQRDIIFTNREGWHQFFAGMWRNLPLTTKADFESYLARLEHYPRLNQQNLAITRNAIRGGFTLPCSTLAGYERTITGVIVEDPAQSRFYEPFARPKPAGISDADWSAMQARARRIVADVLYPEYRRHAEFWRSEYMPRCARTDSVSAQPRGREYYDFLARSFTTTDLSARQIHDIGLREVARIRAEMDAVAQSAGFATRQAYIQELRTNPLYYPRTGEELMRETALVAKQIDEHMPRLFGRLPRLPFTLRAIPMETAEGTTTAYYNQGSISAGIAGTYYVNLSLLNQRPLWEVPALSLHEAAPGHHTQIALSQELEIPPYRQNFVGFTAFTEGWGLYAESLGEEMGLYDTPERRMGMLSYQMWRACRLVVDTGIHAFGWDKARAIAFMRENTALSDANIEAEVNRYIAWPGQALGYMIGRLKILELRARAQAALGDRFDIRRFHDAVLRNGSVPLNVLESEILAWIEAERGRAS
ncbi:MAG: DUF885 domain-containing protein [Sphingosinicella sp.]